VHQSICDLIARKLRLLGFLEVVGIYRDTAAALRDSRHTLPEIVILDTELNGNALIETLSAFRQISPTSKLVLFTAVFLKPDLVASLPPDSIYIANKHDNAAKLLEVIWKASKLPGMPDFSLQHSTDNPSGSNYDDEINGKIQGTLSDKEIRILTLIAMSNSTKQIASLMGISANTVSNYRAKIMYKISAKDQAGMVRYALIHGLIDPHL